MSAKAGSADVLVPDLAADMAQLERELAQVRLEFQDFVHSVSHDLRAPLRHINAFAKIIEEDLPNPPPDILEHLATIRQSAQLLAQQLDGLTLLSRLGQQPVQCQAVDLLVLVQGVADELTQRYPERQVQWQFAQDLPSVWADAQLLRQVFGQVLDNAHKFSRGRQPAFISLTWAGLEPVRPGQPDQCHISVHDNGVGFLPAQADKLFKVFAKLHPARQFEGLGLGLVYSRKMLERMGGSIRVTGEADVGCHVVITLPNPPTALRSHSN